MHRRAFLQTIGFASLAAPLGVPLSSAAPSVVKPKRLVAGNTVALVSPASATFQSIDVQIAKESLEALGLTVHLGEHLLNDTGIWAETTRRAPRISTRSLPTRRSRRFTRFAAAGAASRVLPVLDFDLIRRNPKVLLGYSDITALLLRDSCEDRPGDVSRADREWGGGMRFRSTTTSVSCSMARR